MPQLRFRVPSFQVCHFRLTSRTRKRHHGDSALVKDKLTTPHSRPLSNSPPQRSRWPPSFATTFNQGLPAAATRPSIGSIRGQSAGLETNRSPRNPSTSTSDPFLGHPSVAKAQPVARSAVADYGSSTTNIALERLRTPPGDSTRLGEHRLRQDVDHQRSGV
jgi:hypothetical protein